MQTTTMSKMSFRLSEAASSSNPLAHKLSLTCEQQKGQIAHETSKKLVHYSCKLNHEIVVIVQLLVNFDTSAMTIIVIELPKSQ